jgi:hypothetical protein
MPELLSTLKAIYEKEHRNNRFMAAIQGIDIDNENASDSRMIEAESEAVTLEEVYSRAIKKLGGSENESEAIKHGFTPDMGLDYEVMYN